MIVTAYKGGTYGISVSKKDIHHFPTGWKKISIEIEGHFHQFNLTSTFWTTCPHFRGSEIKRYLLEKGLDSWKHGKPPKLDLTPLGGNRFRLS